MLRDCPPIPPNHEFFSVKYQEFNWPDTFHWELTLDIGKQNRSVIAAVARCAWLDEILDDDYDASGGLNEHGLLCQDNANAWRVWGLT